MNRTQHEWTAHLQADDGQTEDVKFKTFWNPDEEDAAAEVARAAAAQATVKSGKTRIFAGISATYKGPVSA